MIEMALSVNARPTSGILQSRRPFGKWTAMDWACLEAYQMVQNERCAQCGGPKWICHNEDGDIGFKVVEDICFATKEIETQDEKKQNRNSNYKPPKGVRVRPEAFRYSGRPIDGDMREAYYEALSAKMNPESQPEDS